MSYTLVGLAVHDKVVASTQNDAFCALLFLYREVLKQEFPDWGEVKRAKRSMEDQVVQIRKIL
jgi:hypothetical protein